MRGQPTPMTQQERAPTPTRSLGAQPLPRATARSERPSEPRSQSPRASGPCLHRCTMAAETCATAGWPTLTYAGSTSQHVAYANAQWPTPSRSGCYGSVAGAPIDHLLLLNMIGRHRGGVVHDGELDHVPRVRGHAAPRMRVPVSYTHLTLPTILLV
eukprot:7644876-Pyramimonas_sp.AAC.1